jgi:glutathione peroxidase
MAADKKDSNFFDFSVKATNGTETALSQFKGKVVLVINVASKCGFTPQYNGLESIYREFKDQNFVAIGFPCNQFGFQEPGSDQEIQQFCSLNYEVTFPVMAKVDVNGAKADPVYMFLKESAPGLLGTEAIKWNFTKFLIGKDGKVIKRYAPNTDPKEIIPDIQNALL